MAAKKTATKQAGAKAPEKTTAAPAASAPAADTPSTETPAADTSTDTPEDSAGGDAPPPENTNDAPPEEKAPEVKAPEEKAPEEKPAKGSRKEKATEVATDMPSAVRQVLSAHLDKDVVETWVDKVAAAVQSNKIVTITDNDGSSVLEIHTALAYTDRNSVKTLAAKFGRNFKVNVNQAVHEKLGSKK